MNTVTIVLSTLLGISVILNIVSVPAAILFGRELIKKFSFWGKYIEGLKKEKTEGPQQTLLGLSEMKGERNSVITYDHPGSNHPHMGILSFTTAAEEALGVLFCFDIIMPEWLLTILLLGDLRGKRLCDPFSFATSKPRQLESGWYAQTVNFGTYFGDGPCQFMGIVASSSVIGASVKKLPDYLPYLADIRCPPHFFQNPAVWLDEILH